MQSPKVLIPVENVDGNFKAYEFDPAELTWPELRKTWTEYTIKLPMCFAPPETKLEIFFYYACQKHDLPASLGSVYNPGWTDMFLSEVKHDCLIITDTMLPYLATQGLFAEALEHIKLVVCVGSSDVAAPQNIKEKHPNIVFKTVAYPLEVLCA